MTVLPAKHRCDMPRRKEIWDDFQPFTGDIHWASDRNCWVLYVTGNDGYLISIDSVFSRGILKARLQAAGLRGVEVAFDLPYRECLVRSANPRQLHARRQVLLDVLRTYYRYLKGRDVYWDN